MLLKILHELCKGFVSLITSAILISRGGGGGGKKWSYDGRRTKKLNSVKDYISCAKFLVEREIVGETKLAGWGYSAGGLLVASAINFCPDLFRAAVLKVDQLNDIYCTFSSSSLLCQILFMLHASFARIHKYFSTRLFH